MMGPQDCYQYGYHEGSQQSQFLFENMACGAAMPVDMMRSSSNGTSTSAGTRLSDATRRSISSSATTMSPYPDNSSVEYGLGNGYENSYHGTYDSYIGPSSHEGLQRSVSARSGPPIYTPSFLGWQPDTLPLDLYRLMVPKGKEPYFELKPECAATLETPERVYLDSPT